MNTKIVYPVSFLHDCPHCGTHNSIVYEDIYGNTSKRPIYAVTEMCCIKCGKSFFIHWIETDGKTQPWTSNKNNVLNFEKEITEFYGKTRRHI